MLSAGNIQSLQIDGRVRFTDRSAILSKFRDDPTIFVLLMSIDTGAVGYDGHPHSALACYVLSLIQPVLH